MSRKPLRWPCRFGLPAALGTLVCVALPAAGPVQRSVSFHDDFESASLQAWQFPFPEDWEILAEGPNHFLHMKRMRDPAEPRRPVQFGLVKTITVGSFDLQTRVRRAQRSMMVVFNYVCTSTTLISHAIAVRSSPFTTASSSSTANPAKGS